MFDYSSHGLIPSERRPEIPGSAQNVVEILDRALGEDSKQEALVGRYARYTYEELDRRANQAAHAFLDLGIGPGDRVAASLPNHCDIVVAFLGAMRVGAIWLGINRALAPPEKEYLLSDAGVQVLLADPETLAKQGAAETSTPHLQRSIQVDPSAPNCAWRALLDAAASTRPEVDIDPFAPAAIAYTSGTTGFPKGAVHSQHNLLLPGAVSAWLGTASAEMRLGVCLPLSILNLMVLGPLVAFQSGSTCVAMDRVDPVGIAGWIRDERIETFAAVPTMVHGLLTHPGVSTDDLRSLVRPGVGGADCPDSFLALYRERFGCEVTVGYGMTEAPTSVSVTDPSRPPVPGSCGKALPQVEITIRDEDDHPVSPGDIGEVCVTASSSGPWAGVYTPTLGYWNQSEASADALRNGFYHTGDLGRFDDDGNLFIVDRRSDLILRGGANVYPAEVERVLYADGRVA